MQHLWMKFYDNNFVYAYFAKLRAQLTQVKRDFGDDNFAIVKEFTTFFVRGERRRLFAHIDAGRSLEAFSPITADKPTRAVPSRAPTRTTPRARARRRPAYERRRQGGRINRRLRPRQGRA
jgi:hypothetical protein